MSKKRRNPGLGWVLAGLLVTAAIASCEAASSGHLVAEEAYPVLPDCPEPICPVVECPAPSQEGTACASSPQLVDLNHASLAELLTLPGVGESTAQRIIEFRSRRGFRKPQDVMRVKGIGPSKFKRLRARVTVTPRARPKRLTTAPD